MFQANKWFASIIPFNPDNNPVKFAPSSPFHRPDELRPREWVSSQATVTEPADTVEELELHPYLSGSRRLSWGSNEPVLLDLPLPSPPFPFPTLPFPSPTTSPSLFLFLNDSSINQTRRREPRGAFSSAGAVCGKASTLGLQGLTLAWCFRDGCLGLGRRLLVLFSN